MTIVVIPFNSIPLGRQPRSWSLKLSHTLPVDPYIAPRAVMMRKPCRNECCAMEATCRSDIAKFDDWMIESFDDRFSKASTDSPNM